MCSERPRKRKHFHNEMKLYVHVSFPSHRLTVYRRAYVKERAFGKGTCAYFCSVEVASDGTRKEIRLLEIILRYGEHSNEAYCIVLPLNCSTHSTESKAEPGFWKNPRS